MSTLAAQQRRFMAAIVGDAPDPALRGRVAVYRHAYRARLAAALRDNHSLLPRALGDEAFDALAAAYVQAHPSRSASIRWFGAQLAAFMATRDDLVPHPALIDLARMEWALRAAFDAADAPLLQAATLAALPAADWPGLVLRLHPSVQRLALQWQVEPAWRALQAGAEAPAPEPGAHTLLAWRPALDTRWRSAQGPLEAHLLDAVAQGRPFAALCALAAADVGEAAAPAQVVAHLQQWLAEGLLRA